jgi:hypothetical protein
MTLRNGRAALSGSAYPEGVVQPSPGLPDLSSGNPGFRSRANPNPERVVQGRGDPARPTSQISSNALQNPFRVRAPGRDLPRVARRGRATLGCAPQRLQRWRLASDPAARRFLAVCNEEL